MQVAEASGMGASFAEPMRSTPLPDANPREQFSRMTGSGNHKPGFRRNMSAPCPQIGDSPLLAAGAIVQDAPGTGAEQERMMDADIIELPPEAG